MLLHNQRATTYANLNSFRGYSAGRADNNVKHAYIGLYHHSNRHESTEHFHRNDVMWITTSGVLRLDEAQVWVPGHVNGEERRGRDETEHPVEHDNHVVFLSLPSGSAAGRRQPPTCTR